MFREIIDKLKKRREKLYELKKDEEVIELNEDNSNCVSVSIENDIYKIEVSDYISLNDFLCKVKLGNQYNVLNYVFNYGLWNSDRQKANKGIYYVILVNDYVYNIIFCDDKIVITERLKKHYDEQTQRENIKQDRVITIKSDKTEYHYFSAKHESNGSTYYTKYYNKNRLYSMRALDLTDEEAFDEISSVIRNLENIKGIDKILDLNSIKEYILDDLKKNDKQIKLD